MKADPLVSPAHTHPPNVPMPLLTTPMPRSLPLLYSHAHSSRSLRSCCCSSLLGIPISAASKQALALAGLEGVLQLCVKLTVLI